MTKSKPSHYSRLFQLTVRFFKYLLLAIFGLTIAYILSMSFGVFSLFAALLPFLGDLFGKLTVILLCLITVTVILESLR
ncbi:hypothetical protein IJ00_02910 [Calothrix sp. 336/3]|uniref:hypothetical protein n=1 Tax=Calothrix sp. 336/3 TaxID=1337936 RepID=UPI0004E440DF|nr:hypothetical protein [Calothrix sp. 336/3]AKG24400.1 hypothetical protein IJ00_02910 [Calothrix sp. 336/3]